MRHRPLFASCAVGAVLLAAGIAVARAADTLGEALIDAYNGNPQILSERANLRAIDEGVSQALSGWRPTVTVTGSGGV
jgi:outer membrane protein